METGTTLKIQVKGANTRITSELIGIEEGEYLIIKMPPLHTLGDTKTLLYKGTDIVVRYLLKGTVFGFQSVITDLISTPKKLIFIEYPKKFDNYELRTNKRMDCYLPASINISNDIIEGSITDISKEGCQFIVETSKVVNRTMLLQIDNKIDIRFQLPGVEKKLIATAQQKNVKKDKNSVNIGIWFTNMDAEIQTIFYDFLTKAGV